MAIIAVPVLVSMVRDWQRRLGLAWTGVVGRDVVSSAVVDLLLDFVDEVL